MDSQRFELAGIVLRSPMNAATNVVLAACCLACVVQIRASRDTRTRMWRHFLMSLGMAAALGVVKHGLAEYAASSWHQAVTLLSNLSAGAATYYAQRATLETPLFGNRSRRVILTFVRLQWAVFALQVTLKLCLVSCSCTRGWDSSGWLRLSGRRIAAD